MDKDGVAELVAALAGGMNTIPEASPLTMIIEIIDKATIELRKYCILCIQSPLRNSVAFSRPLYIFCANAEEAEKATRSKTEFLTPTGSRNGMRNIPKGRQIDLFSRSNQTKIHSTELIGKDMGMVPSV